MKTEHIKEKVRDYIKENTFAEKSKIENNTLIFKEGYFDSMGFVSLLSFIEEQFGIEPQDNDLVEENFESVNAITKFIEDRTNHN